MSGSKLAALAIGALAAWALWRLYRTSEAAHTAPVFEGVIERNRLMSPYLDAH